VDSTYFSCCIHAFKLGAHARKCGWWFCAQMAIKQAMAYWATDNSRYADNALGIVEAWTNTNTAFGLQKENGELHSLKSHFPLSPAVNFYCHLNWFQASQSKQCAAPQHTQCARLASIAMCLCRGLAKLVHQKHALPAD
jgi:hypothetical protein